MRLFLRLGFTAFGGPAAHIAMMEDEVVRRRKWLTREEFLDLLGAVNLIPGPNSTELAIHIGHRRNGWGGLLLAGVCFIVPAMLIVLAIAWAYVRYGKLPQTQALLYGIKPAIIAIIIRALCRLGRTALKTPTLAIVGLSCAAVVSMGVNELLVLTFAGCAMMAGQGIRRKTFSAILPVVVTAGTVPKTFGLASLFLFFFKTGSVLFGSGYVLLAFLRADLVERWHWLSESQLLDAIAIGQVTPGPVFTTATFIGYILGGWSGALVATAGIFLPAFFFVAISGPLVPRIRGSPMAGAFLDGVNVASLALMAVVTIQLARSAVSDWVTGSLAVVSAIVLFSWELNSAWIIAVGAGVGVIRFFF